MARTSSQTRLGYDTRSLRSAFVMAAIDALHPWRARRPFEWRKPLVVSSAAGLGDLFIHLPLISGIVRAANDRELPVSVALRPAHAEIGARCGWNVIPFSNGLEEFFKPSSALKICEVFASVRRARLNPAGLWIDLTGNAVSAGAIKSAGAQRLAARVTRGGRSLIDHVLPHAVGENEYRNRERVAGFLGCDIDDNLPHRLHLQLPPANTAGSVVLCITTASRWKNWPLANFRALIQAFPEEHFTIVGFGREILPGEQHEFERIVQHRNVTNLVDKLTVVQLVDLIGHCRATVTNDTSAAHIANFFKRPGAVLFGPISPATFASPGGLRVFHDATCPLHPCVQWRCDNQPNWCMRKIDPAAVAAHLRDVLAASKTSGATTIVTGLASVACAGPPRSAVAAAVSNTDAEPA